MIATPSDSRYVPFNNPPSCCVPACVQMVMYRRGIPLLPAEEIGYHLGLAVTPDQERFFWRPRVADDNPRGWAVRFDLPEYEPNTAFARMGIPLRLTVEPVAGFASAQALLARLCAIEADDEDAILAWNVGVLLEDADDEFRDWAHATVFDRVIDGRVRIIDPGWNAPKWSSFTAERMLAALQRHARRAPDWAGIWLLSTT